MATKPPTTKEQLETIIATLGELSSLNELVGIVPYIKQLVEDRKQAEEFNKRFAKLGRRIIMIAGGIGVLLGTMWAVIKLIFTLGNNQ